MQSGLKHNVVNSAMYKGHLRWRPLKISLKLTFEGPGIPKMATKEDIITKILNL